MKPKVYCSIFVILPLCLIIIFVCQHYFKMSLFFVPCLTREDSSFPSATENSVDVLSLPNHAMLFLSPFFPFPLHFPFSQRPREYCLLSKVRPLCEMDNSSRRFRTTNFSQYRSLFPLLSPLSYHIKMSFFPCCP